MNFVTINLIFVNELTSQAFASSLMTTSPTCKSLIILLASAATSTSENEGSKDGVTG